MGKQMKEGTILHGFRIMKIQPSHELHGTMIQMQHPSGAVLYYLDNGVENKVFSIAFRTLPEDHTGVFHILEHSLLCGSERYPVKEPFTELLKGSMNTFLNAMTFPDKTVFPVSSRNEKDYLNLVSVYLDAVFHPRLLQDKRIFYQEGWHIETDESGTPSYKGVVLNEMKGAMSQLSETVSRGVRKMMYPDSCYGFNSGGDPEWIPTLSYESCILMYRKYYHPSNCIVYLDGDVPLEQTMEMLDGCFSRADSGSIHPFISMQQPRSGAFEQYYELPEGVESKNRSQLTYGRILGTWKDRIKCMAAAVLCDVLAGSNEAPLTYAVLKNGLAQDVSLKINASRLQFDMTCTFINLVDGGTDAALRCLHDTAETLYLHGIDREELTASINQMEYADRQLEEPQGITRAVLMLNSVLYGGDPLLYLEQDDAYDALRHMLETNEFENLLHEMFLDDTPGLLMHTLPSPTLGRELRDREQKRLLSITASWTEDEKKQNAEMNQDLVHWQHKPDTPEALETIPRLHLSDIGDMPKPAETILREIQKAKVLFHPLQTDGIVALSIYISLNDFTLHELTVLSLLAHMVGSLPTSRHDARTIQREIRKWIGSFSCSISAYAPDGEKRDVCESCMLVQVEFVEKNFNIVMPLIHELLTETVFDAEKMSEMVMQMREGMRQSLVSRAHSFAMHSALSHFGSTAAVNEACRGFTKWKYLNAFHDHFEEYRKEALKVAAKFQEVLGPSRMVISEAYDTPHDLSAFISCFSKGIDPPAYAEYHSNLPMNSAYCISGQSSAAVLAYRFPETQKYTGSMAVAAHCLSFGTLWNRIRVLGGAYGTGMSIRYNRNMIAYSYRDPTPDRSLRLFRTLSEDIKAEAVNERLEQSIIACIAAHEPLLTAKDEAFDADLHYLTGRSYDESRRVREEMIATRPADLLKIAPLLAEMANHGSVCVVGHNAAIERCSGLDIIDINA